jgi:outer membrane receptor for ferrienterochelin and colicins
LPSNTKPTTNDILRLNFGTGFRGQSFYWRPSSTIWREAFLILKPETSYNLNLNYLKKYNLTNGIINLESSGHLFYKPNFANYDLNPNQIVYDNLNGYSKILDSVLILIGSRHLIKSNCRCHFDPISKTAKICTAIHWKIPTKLGYKLWNSWFCWLYRKPYWSNAFTATWWTWSRREISVPFSIQNIQFTFKKIHNLNTLVLKIY